jgi:hypothetical protein
MRTFDSGATRDKDNHKNDYEGFLSPLVIRAFGDYMQKHRVQADGSVRDSDNWQKSIPFSAYIKSLWRHFMDLWTLHRGFKPVDFDGNEITIDAALGGIMFNTMGYFHELLVKRLKEQEDSERIAAIEQAIQLKPKDWALHEALEIASFEKGTRKDYELYRQHQQALPAFHGNAPILEKDFLVGEEPHCIKCLLPKHHCHCGD